MTGLQTTWCIVAVGVILVGLRSGVPALIQIHRRRAWERHSATVTEVSAQRDRLMSSTSNDDIAMPWAYTDELKWYIAYTYWADGGTHSGRSRHRALPPPATGCQVPVLVNPRRSDRSQFDEPESPLARLAVGVCTVAIALPVLATALGLWEVVPIMG